MAKTQRRALLPAAGCWLAIMSNDVKEVVARRADACW